MTAKWHDLRDSERRARPCPSCGATHIIRRKPRRVGWQRRWDGVNTKAVCYFCFNSWIEPTPEEAP